MSPYRKVLIPTIAGLIIAGSAQGQLLPTWESQITLTQQDMEMSNPASQNSGSVRLFKKLVRKGQQCEDIDYTVRSGAPVYTEHYHLTSCLQPDGTWKLA